MSNTDEVFKMLQVFTSQMYGISSKKHVQLMNSSRFEMFLRNYKIKNVDEPFHKKNLKNFDSSSLPPCETELRQHFERSRFISNVWSNAHLKFPTELEPTECGWTLVGSFYEFKWFNGPQMPSTVSEIIANSDIEKSEAEGKVHNLLLFT